MMTDKQINAFNELISVVNEAIENEKKAEEKFNGLKKELEEYMKLPDTCRGCGNPLNNYCQTCQKDLES